MDYDTEILRLIDTSIFLDKKRKEKLVQILETLSDEDKRKLHGILRDEKSDLSRMFKEVILKKGKEGIDDIDKTADRKITVNPEKAAEYTATYIKRVDTFSSEIAKLQGRREKWIILSRDLEMISWLGLVWRQASQV